jgi:1-aminocyclopropane-1-carboxylate deaminase
MHAIGIVRGEELDVNSNETLVQCSALGMELKFVSREEYNLRNDRQYWEELMIEHPNHYVVPEGGSNYYGMIGCQEIMNETPNDFDQVFVAQGTTTTSLGVLISLPSDSTLNVVPALKGFDALKEMQELMKYSGFEQELVTELLEKVEVHDAFHFGGYGKYTAELLDFMEDFYRSTSVPLDPIYTGKALYALMKGISLGNFDGQKILFIHSGGVQGGRGIAKKEGRTFFDPAFLKYL